MNAGTVNGSSTEPGTSPLVTYTAGDWDATTDIYTAPVGANMTEAQVGRFASLAHDGDTTPTTNQFLIGRITAVNSGTRQITISTSARMTLGTEVVTGTGNRTLRIGGAWQGPNGSSGYPFVSAASLNTLTDASGNPTRVNFKNDAAYNLTAAISTTSISAMIWSGYTSSYGDGGKAVLDWGTTAAGGMSYGGNTSEFACFRLRSSATTGTAVGFSNTATPAKFYGLSIDGWRGSGFSNIRTDSHITECEVYDSCKAGSGIAFDASGTLLRCIAHSNTGVGGFGNSNNANTIAECIAHNNTGYGFGTQFARGRFFRCISYKNTGAGFNLPATSNGAGSELESCVSYGNGGWGIDGDTSFWKNMRMSNCAIGGNTSGAINTSARFEVSGSHITLASDPYPNATTTNGDFRTATSGSPLRGAGMGTYPNTRASYVGVTGYPDIGAAQSQASGGTSGGTLINSQQLVRQGWM